VNPLYPNVAERAKERCEYCRAPERVFNFAFEVEHIVPRAAGGGDDLGNLALACEACNLYKSDVQFGHDDESGVAVPLFNPRADIWEEHFAFDAESGEIHGRTPTGRASVSRLRLNSLFQRRARRHWVVLGLYP
jgi:hypothetical protein